MIVLCPFLHLRAASAGSPYDVPTILWLTTASYDLCSLYDFVVVCTLQIFTNRKTLACRHVVGAVRKPCANHGVTARFYRKSIKFVRISCCHTASAHLFCGRHVIDFHFSLDMVAFQHKVSIGPLDVSFRGSDDAL